MKLRKLFMGTVSFVEFVSHNKELNFLRNFLFYLRIVSFIFLLSTTFPKHYYRVPIGTDEIVYITRCHIVISPSLPHPLFKGE